MTEPIILSLVHAYSNNIIHILDEFVQSDLQGRGNGCQILCMRSNSYTDKCISVCLKTQSTHVKLGTTCVIKNICSIVSQIQQRHA